MRERSLDEFESIFEQASIPVLDISLVAIRRISLVLKGAPIDESAVRLAAHLKTRFDCEVTTHWPAEGPSSPDVDAARDAGFTPADDPFRSTAELLGQFNIAAGQLIVVPEPHDPAARIVNLDDLVFGAAPPVLVFRGQIPSPDDVFRHILHSLTGNFQQTENFSYSFTLAAPGGWLELLHSIDQSEIEDVRDALTGAPDISSKEGDELLDALARHGERYLKAVVAAGRTEPFDIRYRLEVGSVIQNVERAIDRGGVGLVVVGKHVGGRSSIDSDDYQLMHSVRDAPILAL
jgi:hypothetical protein